MKKAKKMQTKSKNSYNALVKNISYASSLQPPASGLQPLASSL